MNHSTQNQILALRVIQGSKKPLTVAEIIETATSAGATLKPDSYSASITSWFQKATNGWQHVHREKVDHRTYAYYFDGGQERSPEVKRSNLPAQIRTGKIQKAQAAPKPVEKYARVVFHEGGLVIAVDQDGEVIKGRYLQ